MGKKLENSLQHNCQLPDTDNMLIRYIDSGYFVDLRRRFRKFVMCSEDNPRSKLFLKSTAAINIQKFKHLQFYYHMIHPFSLGRVYWELFMMCILLILLIYIPVDILLPHISIVQRLPRILLDTICIIDIVISFFTGYQHSLTKHVVMDRRKVAVNYLRTWFVLDLCSSINADIIILIFELEEKKLWYLKIPSFLKVFRVTTLLKYLERYREWRQCSLYTFKVSRMIILLVLTIIWNTSLLYLVAREAKEHWLTAKSVVKGMSMCFFRIILNILQISHGQGNSKSMVVLIMEIACLSLGFAMNLTITAQVIQIVMKYTSLSDKYYQMIQQFKEYMKSKNLPENVQKRVLDYFQFRFQRNYYKENEILGSLSNQLKQEIIVFTCNQLLQRTVMFQNLPTAFTNRISQCMKMEIFLPNDIVVTCGGDADTMFFIVTGMVAVYDRNGIEVCHLADGSYFGEISLFMVKETRKASVVAIDFCEMYTLSRLDFASSIAPYPDLLQQIEEATRARQRELGTHQSSKAFGQGENVKVESRTRIHYDV